MLPLVLYWFLLPCAVSTLFTLAWLTARRFHQARRGEMALLRRRRRILRLYRSRRDGRAYHPERNPEMAALLERDRS